MGARERERGRERERVKSEIIITIMIIIIITYTARSKCALHIAYTKIILISINHSRKIKENKPHAIKQRKTEKVRFVCVFVCV